MKGFFAGLVVLASVGLVWSQTAVPWGHKMFVKDGVPHTEHDFGVVPRGTILTHRFPITNIYAVPMQVTDIRVSCGCVTATASTQLLQPHQTGYVDVAMDTRKIPPGHKTVSLYVTVGPQYVSVATLKVSATSRADVVLNPGQINFGTVLPGQTPTQFIDIEYAGNYPWRIVGAVKGDAPVEIQVQPLPAKQPGYVGYRALVTLLPGTRPGPLDHEFSLQTNDPAGPVIPVHITGLVQASLKAVPDRLSLPNVPVGQPISRRIVLQGNNQPFRILAVDGQGDGLTVEMSSDARPVQIVTITFVPQQPGRFERQLTFRTSIDRDATASVTIEGNAQPAP
jgi:hypothetical protein